MEDFWAFLLDILHDWLEHGWILADGFSETNKHGLVSKCLKLFGEISTFTEFFILISTDIWVLLIEGWDIIIDQIFNGTIRVHIGGSECKFNFFLLKSHSNNHLNILSMFFSDDQVISAVISISWSINLLGILDWLLLDLLGSIGGVTRWLLSLLWLLGWLVWLFACSNDNEFSLLDIAFSNSFFIWVLFSLMNKFNSLNFKTFLLLNTLLQI